MRFICYRNTFIVNTLNDLSKKIKKTIDAPPEFGCTCPVMKTFLRKFVLVVCLVGLGAAFVTPVEAARAGGTPSVITNGSKSVISRW